MKLISILLMLSLIIIPLLTAEAGQIIERKTFFADYDPISTSFVYDDDGTASTGDVVAVNTYTQKSIQITGMVVGENIQIRIEGRSKDQINARSQANSGVANWAVLDTVNFGAASADSAINQVVEVTEYVDFLRVGVCQADIVGGVSSIDVEGIFTNIQR